MSITPHFEPLLGNWQGENHLWLYPGDPTRKSQANATLATTANGKFLTLRYTWFEDAEQEGFLLIERDAQTADLRAVWVDSWHNGDRFMLLQGSEAETGLIALRGEYPAPPGPNWGWRIELHPGAGAFWTLRMYNITPEGLEALAVQTEFTPSAPETAAR